VFLRPFSIFSLFFLPNRPIGANLLLFFSVDVDSGHQRRVHLVEVQLEQLGNAVLLHGHAIEDVGGLHGAAAVGDDDELGLAADPPQILGEADHVGVVQGGLDLVQDAEGRGVDRQDGKVDADGDEGPFPAREGFQVLDDLARRADFDLDAAAQHVALVLEGEGGLPAAEQLGEDPAELGVDGGKVAAEDVPHLAVQLADHADQAGLALLYILHLGLQGLVAAAHLLVFLHGPHVDAAHSPHFAAHFGHLGPQRGHAVVCHAAPGRIGGGQLVFVPELGGQLVVFALGGALALRQAGHFPAGLLPVFGGGAGGGLGFCLGGLPLHPAIGGRADGGLFLPAGGAPALGL